MRKRVLGLASVFLLCFTALSRAHEEPELEDRSPALPIRAPAAPTFSGSSNELKATRVVATLDAPMPHRKNVIWCASFQAAWKALDKDVGEPVRLEGAPPTAERLRLAPDPTESFPVGSLYVAAGWRQEGILDRINSELARQFPKADPPVWDAAGATAVAYAYLSTELNFPIPYFQNRKPFEFSDSQGRKTQVTSFGIRKEDDYAYRSLRRQAGVLMSLPRYEEATEYAIDLCSDSKPFQLVVAVIKPEATLQGCVDRVIGAEAAGKKEFPEGHGVGINDVLLVPDLFWQVAHYYSDLENRRGLNGSLKGQMLAVARQDIRFRLSRSGVELKSEAKILYKPIPQHYIFDRPFLIYAKRRDAKRPFFAMWVDNAELLSDWNAGLVPEPVTNINN